MRIREPAVQRIAKYYLHFFDVVSISQGKKIFANHKAKTFQIDLKSASIQFTVSHIPEIKKAYISLCQQHLFHFFFYFHLTGLSSKCSAFMSSRSTSNKPLIR